MADPYAVLKLAPDANDEQVRRRYLDLVRQHPPEQEPARFAEIRAAYEQLRDPATRLQTQLFNLRTDDSIDEILAEVRARLRSRPIPTDILLSIAEK
jgi:curved DNA-binding protein CbpA